jgi:hypothetical protein
MHIGDQAANINFQILFCHAMPGEAGIALRYTQINLLALYLVAHVFDILAKTLNRVTACQQPDGSNQQSSDFFHFFSP